MRAALVGAAFSAGGAHPGCRHAPRLLLMSQPWPRLAGHRVIPTPLLREHSPLPLYGHTATSRFADDARALMRRVQRLRQGGLLPVVLGGDHSCAIGSWAGIARPHRPLGLLWIDAHLDAHTPASSESGRLHGMPLAVLLGQGDTTLTGLAGHAPLLAARYCAVIGVRSYEAAEPEQLRTLGVRFYTRDEIRQRGLHTVMREAWQRVAQAPGGFGVSLDLDVLEPAAAPGVSVPARDGLTPARLMQALRQQGHKQRLRALELAEFNPERDPGAKTRRLVPALLQALLALR